MRCGEYNNESSVFRNGRKVDRCVNGCWPSNLRVRTVYCDASSADHSYSVGGEIFLFLTVLTT